VADAQVELRIRGQVLGGWTSVSVTRSVETVAGTFELGMSELAPDDPIRRRVALGETAEVLVDGETVLSGYVDRLAPSYSPSGHEIRVEGRDRTGDLVDCTAAPGRSEWVGARVDEIARDLAAPFGIRAQARADPGARFGQFRIEPGERILETIERAARYRRLVPFSDGRGDLVLDQPGRRRAHGELRLGRNLLGARAVYSDRERYSEVTVRGQSPAAFDAFGLSSSASAADPAIRRHRPLVVQADSAASTGELETLAQAEVSRRAGEGTRIRATVVGWRQTPGGELWEPGTRVTMRDAWLGVARELVIGTARYTLDETTGETTVLRLLRPEVFAARPLDEPASPEAELWSRPGA